MVDSVMTYSGSDYVGNPTYCHCVASEAHVRLPRAERGGAKRLPERSVGNLSCRLRSTVCGPLSGIASSLVVAHND